MLVKYFLDNDPLIYYIQKLPESFQSIRMAWKKQKQKQNLSLVFKVLHPQLSNKLSHATTSCTLLCDLLRDFLCEIF